MDNYFPLQGRVALITGANRGLGLEIAAAYLKAGASVTLCARDEARLLHAAKGLSEGLRDGQKILHRAADVTDPGQMAALVKETLATFGKLHILVNNAGVYGPFGPIEQVDWEEWKQANEINLYGSIIPIREVLPYFKSVRYGKIIQLSGGGATNPLPRITAYAASKAAVVRFAESVALECAEFGIDVNSIAPGALNTRLLDEVLEAGPERVGPEFFARSVRQKEEGGVSLAHGADLAVFLGSQVSDGVTGRLISAVWDNWRDWPQHLEQLRTSDAYTLRRVVGKDRGLTWGDK